MFSRFSRRWLLRLLLESIRESFWGLLGPLWPHLGALWGIFGSHMASFGPRRCQSRSSLEPKLVPDGGSILQTKIQRPKGITVAGRRGPLQPFQAGLWTVLDWVRHGEHHCMMRRILRASLPAAGPRTKICDCGFAQQDSRIRRSSGSRNLRFGDSWIANARVPTRVFHHGLPDLGPGGRSSDARAEVYGNSLGYPPSERRARRD